MKKEGWGGGGSRTVKFTHGQGEIRQLKVSGKQMVVSIGQGLPVNSSQCLLLTHSIGIVFMMQMLTNIWMN